MRKKKICYSPEEKEYIAAMDRLHFQPEDKMAIVNRVVSEVEKRATQGQADTGAEKLLRIHAKNNMNCFLHSAGRRQKKKSRRSADVLTRPY